MAQIRFGDGSDAPATEVITVADLLSRNAPAPVREVEPDTGGISVGALLRREGRAPHADRPLQLRPHQPQPRADAEDGPDRRVLVRRGAIAAGTLLAAGSVLGAALLTDVAPTANQNPAAGGTEDDGPYAGQGLLDPEAPVAAPQDSVVIDQAAARDPLDPGAPAPSDWVPVAFPGALAGENAGTGATDGGDPGNGGASSSSGDDSSPAAAAAGDDDDDAKKSSGSSSGSSSSSTDSSRSSDGGDDSGSSTDDDGDNNGDSDGGDDDDRGLVGDLVNTVGGVLGLGGDSDDGDDDNEDSKSSRSMSLMAADDGDEEDSSAPQDEDDSESGSDAKSSDSEDGDGDSDGGDSDDDGDGGGLVGGLLGTVGGLLR